MWLDETPWYASMLEEAGLTRESLLAMTAGECEAALLAAGVDERHTASLWSALCSSQAPASAAAATSAPVGAGGCSPAFLATAAPLYDVHMGVENMAPLLYSLVRFTKPRTVVELGAGYTTLFLLQALADNAEERAALALNLPGTAWLDDAPAEGPGHLHVVDNCAHEHSTAGAVSAAASSLGLRPLLSFHAIDAFSPDLPSMLPGGPVDILWIDLGAGPRLTSLVAAWWPRIRADGGILAVHSTLTNETGRAWLAHMKRAAAAAMMVEANALEGQDVTAALAALPYGCFELLSLLEPHKRLQNSFTCLRRRGGGASGAALYSEPIFSRFP